MSHYQRSTGASRRGDKRVSTDWWHDARQSLEAEAHHLAQYNQATAQAIRGAINKIDACRSAYMDKVISVQEAAQLAGCHVSQINRDLRNGHLTDYAPFGGSRNRVKVRQLAALRGIKLSAESDQGRDRAA